MRRQAGFTLIELMISLVLGLVVVAAAIMLFLTGVRSQAMQQGISDLQDNANFGLNYITQDVRLANLNTVAAKMDDELLYGGIVLSTKNLPAGLSSTDVALLSVGSEGASNVAQGSDQLVIQYRPMAAGGFDCEGRRIQADEVVIQRYFLREDDNASQGEGSPLALACDAGYYTSAGSEIFDFGGNGEIIMKRVDYFRVLLNVVTSTNQRRYISIDEYADLATKPRILGVSLAALTRSAQSVGRDQAIAQTNEFTVLDQTAVIRATANPNGYIRRVVTQEVALRNALGERQ